MAVGKRKAPTYLEARDEAVARFAQGDLPRLVVVTGDVPFLTEPVLDAIATAAEGEVESFAPRPGEPDSAAFRRLVQDWTTASLFGSGRVLLVRDAGAWLKTAQLGELAEVEAAAHHLVLSTGSLDGRSKLAKRVKKDGGLVVLPPLRDAPPPWVTDAAPWDTELVAWLIDAARRRGTTLDREVAAALVERIGNEPARLDQMLGRLAELTERDELRLDDVARYVPFTSSRLLELFDRALRAGDGPAALQLLDRMRIDGVLDHAGKLVAGDAVGEIVLRTLTSSLARLVTAHEALTPALASALSAKPWHRSADDKAALDRLLGVGGARVFLERDLRSSSREGVTRAFRRAVAALRRSRDGAPVSMSALTLRLARDFSIRPSAPARRSAAPRRRASSW